VPVSVTGYTPSQIDKAYGFNLVTAESGKGVTIAIVDAYNAANLTTDVSTFNTKFGLQQFNVSGGPTLTVVSQTGSTTKLPANNSSWAEEIDLDVEWAHAIAPQANIVLVEANSANMSDLMTAVDYAGAHAQVVSMSFGGSDSSSDTSYDKNFEVPGVSFVAAAGDNGYGVSYPADSPYVLSVGGTTLNLSSTGAYSSESAWSDGGGGVSSDESEPGYQTSFGITNTGSKRGNPDISFDANPNTGVAVYSSSNGGWIEVGGTSVGTPSIAGLIAVADSGRIAAGKPVLTTDSLTSNPFYAAATGTNASGATNYSANYHDITTGSTGRSTLAQAGKGYDLATGLGTPIANDLIPWLISYTAPATSSAVKK
jgi:subtilase family serine protease